MGKKTVEKLGHHQTEWWKTKSGYLGNRRRQDLVPKGPAWMPEAIVRAASAENTWLGPMLATKKGAVLIFSML